MSSLNALAANALAAQALEAIRGARTILPSLLEEARKLVEAEGVALNQLINVAVAEKLSAVRTASYFAERAARADISEALRILERAGVGGPPIKRDELPETGRKR